MEMYDYEKSSWDDLKASPVSLLVLKRDVNSVPVAGTYYTVDIIK